MCQIGFFGFLSPLVVDIPTKASISISDFPPVCHPELSLALFHAHKHLVKLDSQVSLVSDVERS